MYHSRWKGSHYEAGKVYGQRLYKNHIQPLAHLHLTKESEDFALACLPLYQKYYPEILAEIHGMCEGLHISDIDMHNFLLSMYAFSYQHCCSCIAYSYQGHVVFARNSDFHKSIENLTDSAYYQLEDSYRFIGQTTAWIEMEDGINEKGLAVGLTFIYPTVIQPGLNAGMLVRYLLEKCASTKEAIHALKTLPIASQQTITLADRSGDIAVVECNCEKVIVKKDTAVVAYTTNHFTTQEMSKYQYTGEDEIRSHERYATLVEYFRDRSDCTIEDFVALLKGQYGYLCQVGEVKTIWSVIYDLNQLEILRCEGNPSHKKYLRDQRLQQ